MLAALALVAAATLPRVCGQAASGHFNVLSLNVAGLPAILNGNGEGDDAAKQANTLLMGTDMVKFNYSVVHVQEVCPHFPA